MRCSNDVGSHLTVDHIAGLQLHSQTCHPRSVTDQAGNTSRKHECACKLLARSLPLSRLRAVCAHTECTDLRDLVELEVELSDDRIRRIHSVAHDARQNLDCSLRAYKGTSARPGRHACAHFLPRTFGLKLEGANCGMRCVGCVHVGPGSCLLCDGISVEVKNTQCSVFAQHSSCFALDSVFRAGHCIQCFHPARLCGQAKAKEQQKRNSRARGGGSRGT
jgi:hypothetical protein